MESRRKILEQVASEIDSLATDEVTLIAIDGVDGVGKTYFANELSGVLIAKARTVIQASVDGFHNPRDIRYRLGKSSPEGFYRDSYNYDSLCKSLLEPLQKGGSMTIRTKVFDHRTDTEVHCAEQSVAFGSIVVIDGIFLHRPELLKYWHYSIFLNVPFAISIPRGAQRGEGSPDVHAPSNHRYIEGPRIYLSTCQPTNKASIVINNSNLNQPIVEN